MVNSNIDYIKNIGGIYPTLPENFYRNIFEPLVPKTYAKIYTYARRSKLENKFNILTKEIDLEEMQKEIYKLATEMPNRLSMYDVSLYNEEIWSIIFGKYETKLKNLIMQITENIKEKELISFSLSKFTQIKERIDNYINEAIKIILEDNLEEEEIFRIIVYVQGLTILKIVIDDFINKVSKDINLVESWKYSSQIILLSLIISKYLSGTMDPEDFLYNMEYTGEIFAKENKEKYSQENIIEHLEYIEKLNL